MNKDFFIIVVSFRVSEDGISALWDLPWLSPPIPKEPASHLSKSIRQSLPEACEEFVEFI
jgi:acyl-CoA thioesterase